MSTQIIRGNALSLPLADASVDLVVTSPPYFGLRSYQDGGVHYSGQIGDEATPAEFVDALIAATAELVRVTKPTGSIFVNLGDKYAERGGPERAGGVDGGAVNHRATRPRRLGPPQTGMRPKSLMGIPWRYAIRCIDELGLILRAEVIWAKPNGLPESVTDRVRRSHEQWFHFTLSPRYYSAVDEIREPHVRGPRPNEVRGDPGRGINGGVVPARSDFGMPGNKPAEFNPLGKLPGSVWTIPTEPLHVPESLGIDHFAAFPTEWPRRIVQGWSPSGICTACGEGRRPVGEKDRQPTQRVHNGSGFMSPDHGGRDSLPHRTLVTITGEACACPEPTAPTRPAVVLDPFGGTGTTALVAHALGRHGISNDMSADYCRLAEWRTTDPKQIAKAARKPYTPPREQLDGQLGLFDDDKEGVA